MNTNLTTFTNPDFGAIRTLEQNNEPWFVGKDVADILGYSDTAQAVRKHIDDEDKGVVEMTTPGGKQPVTIINESGLYSLILSSKLPTAKKFKHWVTAEVLPSIRKHGGYLAGQESMTGEELMAKALMVAKRRSKSAKHSFPQRPFRTPSCSPRRTTSTSWSSATR